MALKDEIDRLDLTKIDSGIQQLLLSRHSIEALSLSAAPVSKSLSEDLRSAVYTYNVVNASLLCFRPSKLRWTPQDIEVHDREGTLSLSILTAGRPASAVKAEASEIVAKLAQNVAELNKAIGDFHQRLPNTISELIEQRRQNEDKRRSYEKEL
jgi:hypothetical protein